MQRFPALGAEKLSTQRSLRSALRTEGAQDDVDTPCWWVGDRGGYISATRDSTVVLETLDATRGAVNCLVEVGVEGLVCAGCSNGRVVLLSERRGGEISAFSTGTEAVLCAARVRVSNVVFGTSSGTVLMYQLKGNMLKEIAVAAVGRGSAITSIATNATGTLIAVGTEAGEVATLDTELNVLLNLYPKQGAVLAMTFYTSTQPTYDGILWLGGEDGFVSVVRGGVLTTMKRRHADSVTSMAVLKDASSSSSGGGYDGTIVTADVTGRVVVWHAETLSAVQTFESNGPALRVLPCPSMSVSSFAVADLKGNLRYFGSLVPQNNTAAVTVSSSSTATSPQRVLPSSVPMGLLAEYEAEIDSLRAKMADVDDRLARKRNRWIRRQMVQLEDCESDARSVLESAFLRSAADFTIAAAYYDMSVEALRNEVRVLRDERVENELSMSKLVTAPSAGSPRHPMSPHRHGPTSLPAQLAERDRRIALLQDEIFNERSKAAEFSRFVDDDHRKEVEVLRDTILSQKRELSALKDNMKERIASASSSAEQSQNLLGVLRYENKEHLDAIEHLELQLNESNRVKKELEADVEALREPWKQMKRTLVDTQQILAEEREEWSLQEQDLNNRILDLGHEVLILKRALRGQVGAEDEGEGVGSSRYGSQERR